MNLENSIEQLENDYWKDADYPTSLVEKIHKLRKKKLKNLEIEDIRVLISQRVGLNYVVPIAIDLLKENILLDSFFYPGDLLEAVLNLDKEFWFQNKELQECVLNLCNNNITKIELSSEINDEIRQKILSDFILLSKSEGRHSQ